MNPIQIIARKRDGRELTRDEIAHFIQGFASGKIPNYQMAALAMAIYLKGMTAEETAALTDEMLASGTKLSWSNSHQVVSSAADAMPRLERSVGAKHSEPEPLSATSTISIEEADIESELDIRDTVDLGDDLTGFPTVLMDGAANPKVNSSVGGRDTVELDVLPAPNPVRKVLGPVVDKHSTGGLGDKTSLILAPLLACCGLRVPMISGRGLGATGGTLDKLESIPGFRTDLSLEEIREITERVGCVITGATADIAPADRKLYSLRDVTATVASVPLITASIMSKKLAEGLDALVFDVKWGSGAFMKTLPLARKLAESLIETGRRSGLRTVAVLTNMDQPLGRMIGNSLEVNEALEVLSGKGPVDLWQVTLELAVELLMLTGVTIETTVARSILQDHIVSGRALQKFREMVTAQGGNLDLPRPVASFQFEVRAIRSGYVGRINAEALGVAVTEMGGGRHVMSDTIDHAVGMEMLVRIGDRVQVGQPLARVHCHQNQVDSIRLLLRSAIPVRTAPMEAPVLIAERIR